MIHVIFHKDWQTRHEDAMRNVTQGRVEGKSLGDSSDKPRAEDGPRERNIVSRSAIPILMITSARHEAPVSDHLLDGGKRCTGFRCNAKAP